MSAKRNMPPNWSVRVLRGYVRAVLGYGARPHTKLYALGAEALRLRGHLSYPGEGDKWFCKRNFAILRGEQKTTPRVHVAPSAIAKADVAADSFLESFEWRRVRMIVLKRDGARCVCCGATPADGARMNVDHIKPRRFFPQLALDPANLQVLCHDCNHGKGNWDMTDWREKKNTEVDS